MRLTLLLDLTINCQLSEVQCNSSGTTLTDILTGCCKQTRSKVLCNDYLVCKQLMGSSPTLGNRRAGEGGGAGMATTGWRLPPHRSVAHLHKALAHPRLLHHLQGTPK